MHKRIYIALAVVLFLMIVMGSQLLFGDNSLPRQKQIANQIVIYQKQIDSLEQVIDNHKLEIERLKHDSLYKEQILRTRYGMSRKGEKVFQQVK
ncbi:MAG: septum formation initiator family protein [Fibrobacter sp.]|nr:septum formation initiator family protein [Fibrobacter sp.]